MEPFAALRARLRSSCLGLATNKSRFRTLRDVRARGAIPLVIGGDHSNTRRVADAFDDDTLYASSSLRRMSSGFGPRAGQGRAGRRETPNSVPPLVRFSRFLRQGG